MGKSKQGKTISDDAQIGKAAMGSAQKRMSHPYPTYFKPIPAVEEINSLFRYDPVRGRFFWVEKRSKNSIACIVRAGTHYRVLNFPMIGTLLAHRVAWKLITGYDPQGVVDHINGLRDDNRPENLRDVTPYENALNHHGSLWNDEIARRSEAQRIARKAAAANRAMRKAMTASAISRAVLCFGT